MLHSLSRAKKIRRSNAARKVQCIREVLQVGMVDMPKQRAHAVIVVKPACFGFNPDTAADNHFQNLLEGCTSTEVREKAWKEFDSFVRALREAGVDVYEEEDSVMKSPDAVFPNNWITFHDTLMIAIYPMKAANRRNERQASVIKRWSEKLKAQVVDYTHYEKEGKYLEGTGSMVLDRENGLAYACLSERTNSEVLRTFCKDFGYRPIEFHATQLVHGKKAPIYHTNVVMAVGNTLAMVCLESIEDGAERRQVVEALEGTGKEILPISIQQMNNYVGNVLELESRDGEPLLVMSSRAYGALNRDQLDTIHHHRLRIVHCPLDIIETVGGGGARCMLAEVF